MGELRPRRRMRPRQPRNPYHDALRLRVIVRSWAAARGHADLDREFVATLLEARMVGDVEVEFMVRGRDRTLRLPAIDLNNVEPAFERLRWFRQTKQLDQRIAELAASALEALAKAGSAKP